METTASTTNTAPTTAATTHHGTSSAAHVLATPVWVLVIRVFQVLLALIIVALAGDLMHGAYLDEFGLAVATGVITWLVVAYIIFTEKAPSLRTAYMIIAVLALDGFMIVLWLATFVAAGAKRAQFVDYVQVHQCYNDGSLINSNTCVRKRADNPNVLLFRRGLAMFSAIAGLGALVWLLFIAVFVWEILAFFKGRKEGRFQYPTSTPVAAAVPASEGYQMEPKTHDPNFQQQQQAAGQYQQPAPYQQPVSQHHDASVYATPQNQQLQQPVQYHHTSTGAEMAGLQGNAHHDVPAHSVNAPQSYY